MGCRCVNEDVLSKRAVRFALIFEGTGNDESNPSSMTRLHNMLCETRCQRKHITSGCGTRGGLLKRLVCGITGWDLYSAIFEQYRWLTRESLRMALRPDQVQLYLFGFSRGAYQARLFAEFVSSMGIPANESCCKFVVMRFALARVFRCFRKETGFGKPIVRYLGLIDTVRSVFLFASGRRKPSVPTGAVVRHALAKHEARIFFRKLSVDKTTRVEQRFFVGSHSDVGWAYNGDRGTKSLGEIALRWIIEGVYNDLSFIYVPPNPISSPSLMILMAEYMWYLMHESAMSANNLWGAIPLRSRCSEGIKLHESAEAIKDIVDNFKIFNDQETKYFVASLGDKRRWFWRYLRIKNDLREVRERIEQYRHAIVQMLIQKHYF